MANSYRMSRFTIIGLFVIALCHGVISEAEAEADADAVWQLPPYGRAVRYAEPDAEPEDDGYLLTSDELTDLLGELDGEDSDESDATAEDDEDVAAGDGSSERGRRSYGGQQTQQVVNVPVQVPVRTQVFDYYRQPVEPRHIEANICIGVGPNQDVLFAHPERCDKYMQCVHGVPVARDCGPGTYWITDKKHCGAWKDSYCSNVMRIITPTHTCKCNDFVIPAPRPTVGPVAPPPRPGSSGQWEVLPPYHGVLKPAVPSPSLPIRPPSPPVVPVRPPSPPVVPVRPPSPPVVPVVLPSQPGRQQPSAPGPVVRPTTPVGPVFVDQNICVNAGPRNDVLFAHPNRCDKYMQCVHGVAKERDCGPGTYWDPRKGHCGHWQNSYCRLEMRIENPTTTCACNNYKLPLPPPVVVPNTRVTPKPWPLPPAKPYPGENQVAVNPPSPTRVVNPIPVPAPAPVRVPSPVPVPAPAPVRVPVQVPVVAPAPVQVPVPAPVPLPIPIHISPTICKEAGPRLDVIFSHPNRCDKYIQCVHGHPTVRDCGPGTYFDPVKKNCGFWQTSYCATVLHIHHMTHHCKCNDFHLGQFSGQTILMPSRLPVKPGQSILTPSVFEKIVTKNKMVTTTSIPTITTQEEVDYDTPLPEVDISSA